MRTTDPPGQLQEGFEPAPAPTVGPDGHLAPPILRPPVPARPRLCEAGPCRHYHRLEIQVDAENPNAQKIPVRLPVLLPGMERTPDGVVYQPPAVFHTAVEHYCYPDTGIEMVLGATPVVSCNRWAPVYDQQVMSADGRKLVSRRTDERFWSSPQGRAYQEAVQAWEAARLEESRQAEEAERLIQAALDGNTQPGDDDDGRP